MWPVFAFCCLDSLPDSGLGLHKLGGRICRGSLCNYTRLYFVASLGLCLGVRIRVLLSRRYRCLQSYHLPLASLLLTVLNSREAFSTEGIWSYLPQTISNLWLTQGFSTMTLLIFWTRYFFVVEGCPVCCRACSSIPGLYPVDASSTSPILDNHYQISTRLTPRASSVLLRPRLWCTTGKRLTVHLLSLRQWISSPPYLRQCMGMWRTRQRRKEKLHASWNVVNILKALSHLCCISSPVVLKWTPHVILVPPLCVITFCV